jgi:hypothetical protein
MDEVENFFCQFPNPWTLRVSGMGCYTSKCEKKSKSLHPSIQLWGGGWAIGGEGPQADKNLPQSPFIGKFFCMKTFCFGFCIVN